MDGKKRPQTVVFSVGTESTFIARPAVCQEMRGKWLPAAEGPHVGSFLAQNQGHTWNSMFLGWNLHMISHVCSHIVKMFNSMRKWTSGVRESAFSRFRTLFFKVIVYTQAVIRNDLQTSLITCFLQCLILRVLSYSSIARKLTLRWSPKLPLSSRVPTFFYVCDIFTCV